VNTPSNGVADPDPTRPRHSRTEETPQIVLHPVRGRTPEQMSQTDFTHYRLADGQDVDILNLAEGHLIAPTARATITRVTINAAVACSPINILARVLSGMVSVGLNALELVSDRYR